MSLPEEGQKAPYFKLQNQDGKFISLSDFSGKKLILYFYPKDNTPGCTAEACNLRDNYSMLQDNGFAIIGISPDPVKMHQKFSSKYNLPFDILSDTEKTTLNDYGVWGEKKMYGRTYMGVFRTTIIISEDGTIAKVIKKVKIKGHAEQIISELKNK